MQFLILVGLASMLASGSSQDVELRQFVEILESMQPALMDFECEFEGSTKALEQEAVQRLKLNEDQVAEYFSGKFIWANNGDTWSSVLIRSEPEGQIVREQLVIRTAKHESELYQRGDNAPVGRSNIDSPDRINANRPRNFGAVFLLDFMRRLVSKDYYIVKISDEKLDGVPVKLLTVTFKENGQLHHKIYIDMKKGGQVLRWESFASGGALVGKTEIVIGSFLVGSETIWLPVHGVTEIHSTIKNGKAYYPPEPTSIQIIYMVKDTLRTNRSPNPNVFKLTYKAGTPISDKLRKLEYQFKNQKTGKGISRSEEESSLREQVVQAEKLAGELLTVPSAVDRVNWLTVMLWVFAMSTLVLSCVLLWKRRNWTT